MKKWIMLLVLFLFANTAFADVRIAEQRVPISDFFSRHASLCDPLAPLYDDLDRFFPKRVRPLLIPTDGRVTSPFGWRRDPFTRQRRFHTGIDIASCRRSIVHGAADGRVRFAGRSGACGLMLIVDHGANLETRYCHLDRVEVRAGSRVVAGAVIGRMGSTGRATGSHLHFEVRRHGHPVDPVDHLVY